MFAISLMPQVCTKSFTGKQAPRAQKLSLLNGLSSLSLSLTVVCEGIRKLNFALIFLNSKVNPNFQRFKDHTAFHKPLN